MSITMSLKDSSAVVSAGQPLFTKFKSRTKDAESPKSVISDPRIVSPCSSASASLERRLTDLKKAPRHDRVHSISDADEENALPGVNLSAVVLSRQLSAKTSNGHLHLESVSESHSSSTVHPRMGQISGVGSETSSPRVRMSARNTGKDGAKSFARGAENDVANRRMSYPGAETMTSSAFAPLPHPTELPYEDQIELNKFVVRGSGGEEIRTGEHKIAWSPGTTGEPHRNSFSGDGRSSVSGYRHSKTAKKSFSPGESPGLSNGCIESPRSTLIELSSDPASDFAMKATTQSVKDFPEMQIAQKDARTHKSTSYSDYYDRNSLTKAVEGHRKSVDGGSTNTLSAEGSPSDSHNVERSFQCGGKAAGGDTSRTSLMPQQRFVPGQFLKTNPLKPRPSPAKWDDAEKWLVNSASVKSNTHSAYGNGTLSGGSTPQHATQLHAAASARYGHNLPSSNQSTRIYGTPGESLPANTESYGARLLPENCDVNSNTYSPTNVIHFRRSCDASTTTDRPEESLPEDAKVCEMSNRDETGTRPEDKFADSITVQNTSPRTGRVIIVMKDAATEITPSTSQRDIATQVTPAQSFHGAGTPPRLHNGGPARLNTTPVHSERRPASVGVDVTELKNCHQAKLELDQAATLTDTHWTTREEEVEESAKSLRLSVSRSVDFKEVKRNVLEARAAAWEEAEHSKYLARYHREEAKILAWEAHEKAKAEADMMKVEVKLERMRSHANEILQNKLASVHLKAENMRASAAAKCGEQAAKTNHWAQEIRDHGRSPSPTRLCCFPRFKVSYTQ